MLNYINTIKQIVSLSAQKRNGNFRYTHDTLTEKKQKS